MTKRLVLYTVAVVVSVSSHVFAQSGEPPLGEIDDFWSDIGTDPDQSASGDAVSTSAGDNSSSDNDVGKAEEAKSKGRAPFYFGADIGFANYSGIEGAEYEAGFLVSGMVGVRFLPSWRAELDLTYETADFENSADATSLIALNAAAHRDFRDFEAFTPFVGGGFGVVNIDVGSNEGNIEYSGHATSGFRVNLNEKVDLVPALRIEYILLDGIDNQLITQFRAGLRWTP